MPLLELVPIGIDGGLVGVIMLDLVLAWTAAPVAWLRQLTRLLAAGTVAVNVSAGWPDPMAIGLHAAAPMMLLAMVEAGRAVLLRHAGLKAGTARDRIPFGRRVLSPSRTWLLWRRMILWQITSYHTALEIEAQLHRARTQLLTYYGKKWKQRAPGDLVWMLGTAPFAYEACSRIGGLVEHNDAAASSEPAIPAEQPAAPLSQSTLPGDSTQLDEVVRLNERNWEQRHRPMSAETVRKQLRHRRRASAGVDVAGSNDGPRLPRTLTELRTPGLLTSTRFLPPQTATNDAAHSSTTMSVRQSTNASDSCPWRRSLSEA